jgi:hypothetical protein
MRPTWCGRTPRARRSSTTLRNRHQRTLCRMPTPARCALATDRCWPEHGLVDDYVVLVAVAGWCKRPGERTELVGSTVVPEANRQSLRRWFWLVTTSSTVPSRLASGRPPAALGRQTSAG